MARPRKDDSEKRNRRLTLYLTGNEEDALRYRSKVRETEMTKIVLEALHDWFEKHNIDVRDRK